MTSTSIYTSFIPTFLYIKQHVVTGKLYFGKTIKNPETYGGSGKHWKRHIEKHGKEHVVTLWYCLFYNRDELITFATMFSEMFDIVGSDEWLNLIVENGLDGRPIGATHSRESNEKNRVAHLGKSHSDETKQVISKQSSGRAMPKGENSKLTGTRRPDDVKQKIKESLIGVKHSEERRATNKAAQQNLKSVQCPHCGKVGKINGMKRYHFDNCSLLSLVE